MNKSRMSEVHFMDSHLALVDAAGNQTLLAVADYPELLFERHGDQVQIGLAGTSRRPSVKDLFKIMQWVAQHPGAAKTRLMWTFSSVAVDVSELPSLLDRWIETGEPPILSIIALEIGPHRHTTRGMDVLVGFELAAEFRDSSQSRDAARTLARLARFALMNGGLTADSRFESADGRLLHLNWRDAPGAIKMVTIAF
jgi:hypothetical protein